MSELTADLARLWRWALVLSLLFVVYGSLVPLHYQAMSWDLALARLLALGATQSVPGSRVDLASNVLLTMPLAFAAGQCLLPSRRTWVVWCLRGGIVALVLAVSIGIEFAQQFFPPRTMSLRDILAQTAGSLLALTAQARWGEAVSVWVSGWWRRERAGLRLNRALQAYLLVLLVFNLLPLDLTINPVEIFHKWAEGRVLWLPFSGLKGTAAEQLYEVVTDVLVWLPVGSFLILDKGRSMRQVLVAGLLMALLIEFGQLFVFSRVTDVTDILLAGVGVSIGAQLAMRWAVDGDRIIGIASQRAWRGMWWCWVFIVLAVFWYPFSFRTFPSLDVWGWLRVPFATYQLGDEYHAANEVLRRLGFFMPGGLLWGFASSNRSRRMAWWPLLAVALLVESGQVFLPDKVADLTDAALACLGGWLGWRLAVWLCATTTEHALCSHANTSCNSQSRAESRQASHGSWLSQHGSHVWRFLFLIVVFMLVPRAPGVPYNITELVAVGPMGLVSATALAASALLMTQIPLALSRCPVRWVLSLPLLAPLTGAVVFAAMRVAVPMESLYDVVGSPVLDWPWEWELLLRFMALWTALLLPVVVAGLWVMALLQPARLVAWLNGSLVWLALLYPLHLIVVRHAATDNLTELISGQGSLLSFALVSVAIGGLAMVGSALAAAVARPAAWLRMLLCMVFGAVVSPLCLMSGLESAVVKYGQVFSAMQFLLSAQRSAYLDASALLQRLSMVLLVVVVSVAVLQYPSWKRFASAPRALD